MKTSPIFSPNAPLKPLYQAPITSLQILSQNPTFESEYRNDSMVFGLIHKEERVLIIFGNAGKLTKPERSSLIATIRLSTNMTSLS